MPVQVGAMEGAVAWLVDHPVAGAGRQALDDFHLTGAGAVAERAAAVVQRFARRQVAAVRRIEVAAVDDGNVGIARGFEQCGGVVDDLRQGVQGESVLLLHVDDEESSVCVHEQLLLLFGHECAATGSIGQAHQGAVA
ncbi:hypothetical protein D3C78_1314650 [compost metagenome]